MLSNLILPQAHLLLVLGPNLIASPGVVLSWWHPTLSIAHF